MGRSAFYSILLLLGQLCNSSEARMRFCRRQETRRARRFAHANASQNSIKWYSTNLITWNLSATIFAFGKHRLTMLRCCLNPCTLLLLYPDLCSSLTYFPPSCEISPLSHRIPYDALNPLSLLQTCTHNIKAFTSGLTHRCNHRLPQIELNVVKNYTAEHRPHSRSKPYSKIPRGSKKHFASAFVNLLLPS